MVSQELLAILVCPYCKSGLDSHDDKWLLCQNQECRRKYPIQDDIPVMLVEEGSKWRDTKAEDLPDPQGLRF
ncbi:MAG: Trm112 family protein [Anaerolineae bacterium]